MFFVGSVMDGAFILKTAIACIASRCQIATMPRLRSASRTALAAKTAHLKDKLAKLKDEMERLDALEATTQMSLRVGRTFRF